MSLLSNKYLLHGIFILLCFRMSSLSLIRPNCSGPVVLFLLTNFPVLGTTSGNFKTHSVSKTVMLTSLLHSAQLSTVITSQMMGNSILQFHNIFKYLGLGVLRESYSKLTLVNFEVLQSYFLSLSFLNENNHFPYTLKTHYKQRQQ